MSKRPLVVVTDHLAETGVERAILDAVADVRLLQTYDEADVARAGRRRRRPAGLSRHQLTEQSSRRWPQCRGIVRCGVGYDNVDLQRRAAAASSSATCRTTARRKSPTTP